MTQTVKITANSSYQKIADGPIDLILNPVSGVASLIIKTGATIPDPNFANTFTLKSGVVDGGLNPISISNGSSAFIKTTSGNAVVCFILVDKS